MRVVGVEYSRDRDKSWGLLRCWHQMLTFVQRLCSRLVRSFLSVHVYAEVVEAHRWDEIWPKTEGRSCLLSIQSVQP